jgi:hypothetical protein
MSTFDDPDRVGRTPAPGAAPEPGTTTGLTSEGESDAAQRSARRRREREDTGGPAGNMLPGRARRRFGLERFVARLVATGGVIGIGVAIGAILAAASVQGWIIGLVVAVVSVVLSGMLWSSRQL